MTPPLFHSNLASYKNLQRRRALRSDASPRILFNWDSPNHSLTHFAFGTLWGFKFLGFFFFFFFFFSFSLLYGIYFPGKTGRWGSRSLTLWNCLKQIFSMQIPCNSLSLRFDFSSWWLRKGFKLLNFWLFGTEFSAVFRVCFWKQKHHRRKVWNFMSNGGLGFWNTIFFLLGVWTEDDSDQVGVA